MCSDIFICSSTTFLSSLIRSLSCTDHPVNSKRDEEGDIVMEDVNKDSEMESVLSGKSLITTNRIDTSATVLI